MATRTERIRKIYDKIAPRYDRQVAFWERRLFGGGRRWAAEQAHGDVLEIAIGTARNLPYYATDVRLTGIDISPAMLQIAGERAQELGRSVDLRLGDAEHLEFADSSFDTVVCTLALCTIPDPRTAVAETRRVLRPGGRIVLLEHVRSPVTAVRLGQRLIDPLMRMLAADHLLREPLDDVRATGFEIEQLERSKMGIVERLLGRKPA